MTRREGQVPAFTQFVRDLEVFVMTNLKGKAKTMSMDLLFFLLGSLIDAVAINMFTAPNQIAPGGITGIGTMLNYLFVTPIGMVNMLINIPIIIWAVLEIGYKLVAKSIAAIIIFSVAIDTMGLILPAYDGNPLLAAIFGGVLEGIGLGLVFMRGSTTGGTDMIARLLGRHFRHLSMGKLMLAVDMVIIAASALVYQQLESALYATIAIFVSTRVIDTVLYGTDAGTGKMYFIISKKNEEIKQKILEQIDRGVTVIPALGGYSGEESEMLLCAVRRYEVAKINDIIHNTDRDAFVIVGEAGEITGEGFRPARSDDKTLKEIIRAVKSRSASHEKKG